MDTATRRADIEGRYLSARPVSVAWRSETGPRDENQDHALCRLQADGSWLIAVADGLGGHPRARAAARGAIRALPMRIAGTDGMHAAFRAAHKTVARLAPRHSRFAMRDIRSCPASKLSVVAWTPQDGLAVGIAGDCRVVVLWRDDMGWHGRPVGSAHRSAGDYGNVTRFLGAPRVWPRSANDRSDPMDVFCDEDIDTPENLTAFAAVVVSDGAWEALIRPALEVAAPASGVIADAVASLMHSGTTGAYEIAERIMWAARGFGLDDNATVAVAAVIPTTPSDADAA
ncbi:protein phosphatase 2C domain-containing protein [Candidatus Poriferisodalis sp.]|uniref:protein phosphatase 2C domain-containing protein n=1 Tax=Candidatus Poriferisodalis sp. TaxID=3101277 RepID=UPI003B02ADFE